MLGGAVRDELQFYATGARPDVAKELGFIGGKLPLRHGPAEGIEGLHRNVALLADMRAKVGDDFWLMYDCWMSLNIDYATRQIGRASCRERVCQYGVDLGGCRIINKQNNDVIHDNDHHMTLLVTQ